VAGIVISGYYGFGNAGDEAILASIVASLRLTFPDTRLTVISKDPAATAAKHSVSAVGRFDVAGVLSALKRSNVLLSGGGSLLQDVTSLRSLMYYLSIITLAKGLGKRVMLFANGFGPVTSDRGKTAVRTVLDWVDIATFRDQNSYDDVRALGVNRPRMEVTADPVFLLDEMMSDGARALHRREAERALRETGIPELGGPLVGVSLRPWMHAAREFKATLRSVLVRLSASGARVVLVPLHHDQDLGLSEEIVKDVQFPLFVVREELGPETIMEMVGLMDALLGMRLHSLVFAVAKCVPCAAISYDPKVSSFASTVGLPVASEVTCPDADLIYGTIDRALKDSAKIAGVLRERRIEQRTLAKRNFDLLSLLLSGR
jgi:polysaccharide pyruvyl transferase CsaB